MVTIPQDIQQALDALVEAGVITREQIAIVCGGTNATEVLEGILELLRSVQANKLETSPPLNPEDFYREGSGTYEEKWHIQFPLPVPFDDLDRKTRFFVLFQEWSHRELQGLTALGNGQTAEAMTIFNECLARAEQLQANELAARSYEDLARVAQKRNNLADELDFLTEAASARRAG
ncbi:MAG: tetratricopeptide repeat protein [Acidobacteria bacterium]|nr:tetratricopeptide repeat protein [Acidobacteriota bacterium]